VNPFVKYTLARVGLFAVVAAVMLVLPLPINVLLKLMIAVLLSAILALVLLKGMREEVAVHLSARAEQRAAEKERLRAALAGEDWDGPDGPGGADGADGATDSGGPAHPTR
jgi:Protein of unknown function (DUF4229)